jgi:hypothetical protein
MDHQIAKQLTEPSSVTPNLNRSRQQDEDLTPNISGQQMWSGSAISQPETAPKAATLQAHREQLHERVDARILDLVRALDGCDDPLAKGERARAISSAIETARVAMSGGWENVGENEAAMLSQWLQTTADLRVTTAQPATAPQP